jgi:thiamine pyrophosphate-dependent acetolactate synthase large subunit-like protein
MAHRHHPSDREPNVNRRKFLSGAAVAGVAATAQSTGSALAATAPDPTAPARLPSGLRPNAQVAAAEVGNPNALPHGAGPAGSDFMVDVIKTLDIKYLPCNPASSFRGIHESLINYGGNKTPEFITCTHEEAAVAMCHGYFKIAGKPLMTMVHGTVGLQHATMAIYNAWCDRVPLMVLGGTDLDAAHRPPGVPTTHSAVDINSIVRDFTKWDDQPVSLQHFAQSFVRAYRFAMTPPYEPVALALDAGLQEHPIHENGEKLYIPKYVASSPPQGETGAVREAARLLANAERPVIVADRCARTANGMKLLVELAELLQASVVDQGGRNNFPNTHHLHRAPAVIGQADVVLGLELTDFWATVNAFVDNGDNDGHGLQQSRVKLGTKLISINSVELHTKSNYQDFQRFQVVDVGMAADAEATLPSLIEAVKAALPNDRKDAIAKRGEDSRKAKAQARARTLEAAAIGWDSSPISTARLAAELYPHVKDLDWSMIGSDRQMSSWPSRMWPMEKHYSHIGSSGGYGVGYNSPAAVGAALANRDLGRFSINIQPDGDMMYVPGVLWTAARHKIPMLTVMHNNRGYHQEVMHLQRMSNRRDRVAYLGNDLGPMGTSIQNPDIDYAKLAQSMGWWATGPVTDPNELGATFKKAVDVVKSGQPALVDVVTQPR